MITHSYKDYNLNRIVDTTYLSKFCSVSYHVFGLKVKNRSHLTLRFTTKAMVKKSKQLIELFERSGYQIDASYAVPDCDCGDIEDCEYCAEHPIRYDIGIGIRKDIRSDIITSRRLLLTIITSLEGKLKLGKKDKINLGSSVARFFPPKKKISKPSGYREDCLCRSCIEYKNLKVLTEA